MDGRGAIVRVSSKGQIVIPVRFRREMGLRPGHVLRVRANERQEIVLARPEEADDLDVMLRAARAWAARSKRDLVEELHAQRRDDRRKDRRGADRRS